MPLPPDACNWVVTPSMFMLSLSWVHASKKKIENKKKRKRFRREIVLMSAILKSYIWVVKCCLFYILVKLIPRVAGNVFSLNYYSREFLLASILVVVLNEFLALIIL